MSRLAFLAGRRGHKKLHWTDVFTYVWLTLGLILMFGPAVWLILSSFKSPAGLAEFPPTVLPYQQQSVTLDYKDQTRTLPLFIALTPEGEFKELAELRRLGTTSQLLDPANPDEVIKVNIKDRKPVRQIGFQLSNYVEPLNQLNFGRYLWNSVFVTVMATLITLITNSMIAFALAKYEFPGRNAVLLLIISTLMIPIAVNLVPLFSVVSSLGLLNSLWGVILPTVATPTGVFLLRQYMLTIPDELIDAARMDNASEWQIYWRIVLPLSAPALAVLAIFSVVWRWNDFLWPLIVLSRNELFTLQVGLNTFAGELNVQWHFILAMTVATMIPVVIVFVFLQRFITAGIANTGLK